MADDSAVHTKDLESLVPQQFRANLREAEKRLLRAAPKAPPEDSFAVCGPSSDDEDPANDPSKADAWGRDRRIRAELIRWLCVDERGSKRVDPRGLKVYAARIDGELDLSSATVPFPLFLSHCRLTGPADLSYLTIPELQLCGSSTRSLYLDGAEVKGDVFLNKGFSAEGEVRLLGAQIGGDLVCGGGTFKGSGDDALSADRAEVRGYVFLNHGFLSEPCVAVEEPLSHTAEPLSPAATKTEIPSAEACCHSSL